MDFPLLLEVSHLCQFLGSFFNISFSDVTAIIF